MSHATNTKKQSNGWGGRRSGSGRTGDSEKLHRCNIKVRDDERESILNLAVGLDLSPYHLARSDQDGTFTAACRYLLDVALKGWESAKEIPLLEIETAFPSRRQPGNPKKQVNLSIDKLMTERMRRYIGHADCTEYAAVILLIKSGFIWERERLSDDAESTV